jgi:hypothetical protein
MDLGTLSEDGTRHRGNGMQTPRRDLREVFDGTLGESRSWIYRFVAPACARAPGVGGLSYQSLSFRQSTPVPTLTSTAEGSAYCACKVMRRLMRGVCMPSCCRVERWRGGVGFGIFCVGVSPYVPQYPHAVLRFHLPLIEPDWRFSRIRLSDKEC